MPRVEFQYTLLSDGSKDRVLMSILTWLLYQHLPNDCAVQANWADLRRLPRPPKTLHERIRVAVELYPCDVLFIHRDAECISWIDRKAEIDRAIVDACGTTAIPPAIAVVPVRMTESWLLFNVTAIRTAACNPHGSVDLVLPRLADLESISDPKNVLNGLILDATELGTHRRGRFNVSNAVGRIPQFIEDFSPLRELAAFSNLEEELTRTITSQCWGG